MGTPPAATVVHRGWGDKWQISAAIRAGYANTWISVGRLVRALLVKRSFKEPLLLHGHAEPWSCSTEHAERGLMTVQRMTH